MEETANEEGITLALVVVIVATLAACGGGASGGSSDTTWKFKSVEAMGQSVTAEDFKAQAGMDVSTMELIIKADGKFTMTAPTGTGDMENAEGTWEEIEGGYTLTVDGDPLDVTLRNDDKELVMDMGVAQIIFEKA